MDDLAKAFLRKKNNRRNSGFLTSDYTAKLS